MLTLSAAAVDLKHQAMTVLRFAARCVCRIYWAFAEECDELRRHMCSCDHICTELYPDFWAGYCWTGCTDLS